MHATVKILATPVVVPAYWSIRCSRSHDVCLGMYVGVLHCIVIILLTGDELRFLIGMKFSTWDREHDVYGPMNCAKERKSAWWFNKCWSGYLNAPYYKAHQQPTTHAGVAWYMWKGYNYALKFAEMKIRPYHH